jgi:phytoene desaturase
MNEIVKAMVKVASQQGVTFLTQTEVSQIVVENGKAKGVQTNRGFIEADIVVSGADYAHTDQKLLEKPYRNYSEKYWDRRVMSPSSLLFYLGVNRKVNTISHHNLFFDEDFELHAEEIYTHPQWPSKPLFYVCAPSKTDKTVAPEGCENIFILIPIAPDLEDSEEIREKYYNLVMERLERFTGQKIREHVIVKRSYCLEDFKRDYHSFKGNAYGLANILQQTAFFKPKLKSKKVSNLYYTGQLTVPGPGVPPSIISGRIVAEEIGKIWGKNQKSTASLSATN